MIIQTYKNCKSPIPETQSTPTQILLDIKNGKYKSLVSKARAIGKGNKGYDDIKINQIPTCTWNFLFNSKKLNSNISEPTGLIFIDIDDITFDIESIDKSKIYSYYKSISGDGYGILIKVNGLNLDNFNDTYNMIVNDLGITSAFDTGARKATQYNVLSYDPSLFLNRDSYTYIADSSSLLLNKEMIKKSALSPIIRKKEELVDNALFLKLNFKSTLESYKEDCIYIKEGKPYYECQIPFNGDGSRRIIQDGEKHRVLTLFINNLICLNPEICDKQIMVIVKHNIIKYCASEIPNSNIINMIAVKRKELNEGRLKPYGVRLKKFWVDPKCNDRYKAFNDKRIKIGFDALDNFFGDELYNLSTKVTYQVISDKIGICLRTIKIKITKEQKELMKQFNQSLKDEQVFVKKEIKEYMKIMNKKLK